MNQYSFQEMSLGHGERFAVVVTEKMMDDFFSISGDLNPLHRDAAYARQNGFAGKVVYGLLAGSFYSTLVGVYLPGRYALLHGIEMAFHKPVYVGDALTVSGEVGFLNQAYRQMEIKAEIVNQNGERVSKAKIKVGFHG
jgi:3-hydroxybutyryl-CoA dehydratase